MEDKISVKLGKHERPCRRPCGNCGQPGHIKYECHQQIIKKSNKTANKRLKNIDQKIIENPHLLNVIIYPVPATVTDLRDFGTTIMATLGSNISSDQYEITRPWTEDLLRETHVRIWFRDPIPKNKFIKHLPKTMDLSLNSTTTEDSLLVVDYKNHQLQLRVRNDFNHEMNSIYRKALQLTEVFNGVEVTSYGSEIPIAIKLKGFIFGCTTNDSFNKIKKLLEDVEKRGEGIIPGVASKQGILHMHI